jgi:hypothetical protein
MMNYLRASATPGYPDCPRRVATRIDRAAIMEFGFSLHYIPQSIAAAVGTAVHRGAAVMLGEKARTGTLPSRDYAVEASRDGLHMATEIGEITYDGPHGPTHNMDEAVEQTGKMTTAYHTHVAPGINPIIVEEKLEAQVSETVMLTGHPDQVCREPGSIRDLKTGTKMPTTFAVQLGNYSLLARSHDLPIERASIDFIQRVGRNKPQPKPVTVSAAIADAENAAAKVIEHIVRDLDTFHNGDAKRHLAPGDPWAFIANPSSNLCSPKYCPAYGTDFCKEGRRFHEGK